MKTIYHIDAETRNRKFKICYGGAVLVKESNEKVFIDVVEWLPRKIIKDIQDGWEKNEYCINADGDIVEIAKQDYNIIPEGCYCYNRSYTCPFWYLERRKNIQEYDCGGCKLLNEDDDTLLGGLLWDMVKECGIKE